MLETAREMGVNPNTMAKGVYGIGARGFCHHTPGIGGLHRRGPRRVDQERNRLAASARDRFVEEVRELALVPAQIHELLRDLVKGAEDG